MKRHWMVLTLVLLSAPPAVRAQSSLGLDFLPAVQQAAPGSTITFSADATNNSSSLLYLNAADVTMFGTGLPLPVPDLTNFVTNFVFASPLSPNMSLTDEILDVTLDPSTPPGDYFGDLVIFGGIDPNAQDSLVTRRFQVTVVPEPSPLVGLGGFVAMGALMVLRKRKSPSLQDQQSLS